VIVADTSGLLALFNRTEHAHEAVVRLADAATEPLVVSPFVVAELDYLVVTRIGVDAELAMLDELGSGAYVLPTFDAGDLLDASRIIARYREQSIGVADASIVVLADRYRTRELLTLDHRHFDVVRPLSGGRFKLLP
jgi:predicted nucleic acid-binding protein